MTQAKIPDAYVHLFAYTVWLKGQESEKATCPTVSGGRPRGKGGEQSELILEY